MRRAPIALVFALTMLLTAIPASADSVDAQVAASRGSSLPINGDLEWTANNSASSQAANLAIGHTSLGHLSSICARAAEIVGTGPSLDLIFAGFRNSGPHWSKLVDPGWTAMGAGVATGSDGALYVSVVFCEGAGGSTPPPPPPPPPEPAPAPSPTAPSVAPAAAPTPTVAPEPTPLSIDLVGLLSAVLTTSLDSLTTEDGDEDPIAAIGLRYLTERWGPIVL